MKFFDTITENKFYEKHFNQEIMQSERLREFVLGGVILFFAIGSFINVFFLSSNFKEKLPELINAFEWIIFLFLFLAARSFFVRLVIKNRMKKGKKLPYFLRYVNAFFEVSIPTFSLLILSIHIEPVAALVSPMLLLYFFIIIISSLELDPRLSFFTGAVAAAEYILISFLYIGNTEHHTKIAVLDLPAAYIARGGILLVSGILAGIVSIQIRKKIFRAFQAVEERNELEKSFGQQVSKEIVDEILKNKMKIENKTSEVCIMFLDIRDFSKYCEGKTPNEINEYQNSTLGFMIEIVNEHGGIVNQILGDGFMATFGAPIKKNTYCKDAVEASLEIISSLKKKNDNKEIPLTKVGIGLHAGEVVTGNVGTANRKQYSVTGNTVILAARLEQMNKEIGTSLLVSKDAIEKSELDKSSFQSLGDKTLKGFSKQVEVYKLA
jgi:adenylate cyclase